SCLHLRHGVLVLRSVQSAGGVAGPYWPVDADMAGPCQERPLLEGFAREDGPDAVHVPDERSLDGRLHDLDAAVCRNIERNAPQLHASDGLEVLDPVGHHGRRDAILDMLVQGGTAIAVAETIIDDLPSLGRTVGIKAQM